MKNSPIHAIDEALFGTLARRYLRALKKRHPSTNENLSSVKETLAQAIGHANYHAAQAWWNRGPSTGAIILGKTPGTVSTKRIERSFFDQLLDSGFDSTHVSEINRQLDLGAYVIVAGTAGRGKSLTAMAVLKQQEKRRNVERKIFTIEEPPEYVIPSPGNSIGKPDSKPNIIHNWSPQALESLRSLHEKLAHSSFLEELRHRNSADQFIEAVKRLHYGATTIHASSAIGVIERMDDFGVLGDVMRMAKSGTPGLFIYQTLVPKLCQDCCLDVKTSLLRGNQIEATILRLVRTSDFLVSDLRFINSSGCRECNGTGVVGRTAIAELAVFDEKKADAWMAGSGKNKLMKMYELHRSWMDDRRQLSLMEHALGKIRRGQVDATHIEDILGPIRLVR